MRTRIQTIRRTLGAVFCIALLLSIFYACEDDTGGNATDNKDKVDGIDGGDGAGGDGTGGDGGDGDGTGGDGTGGDGDTPAPARVFDQWVADNKAHNLAATTTGTPISTREALEKMAADGEYYLTAHIDLGTADWTPLFSNDAPFIGTLHGNGYIIYNLNINAPEANYQGLFAALSGASIRNLGIGVGSIQANAVAGALAGRAGNGTDTLTLENIIVAGMTADSLITVDGTADIGVTDIATAFGYAGALLGALLSGEVSMLINEGLAVQATGSKYNYGKVGGVVGQNMGTIRNSRSSGAVRTQGGDYAGGLVAHNLGGTVHGSASGDVSTQSGEYLGGLVAYNHSASTVRGSASGNISTQTQSGHNVGGLVGRNAGDVRGSASGNVSTQYGNNVGGLVGGNEGTVYGAASGTVSTQAGNRIGGLVGQTSTATVEGYSTGWVMVDTDNVNTDIGAVVGDSTATATLDKVYYHSNGGDHVGSIDTAPANGIGTGSAGDTGARGTNGIGTGIDSIANATSMSLTTGTADGEWTFNAGEWPHINLPEGIIDAMDYATSPAQPGNFKD